MLIVRTNNAVNAWRETFLKLFHQGENTDNQTYLRDDLVVIELSEPSIEPADPLFPMPASDLNCINHFITTGEKESEVTHEWTKMYFHRMFDEPNSQVRHIENRLRQPEPAFNAVMSLWDKNVDQEPEVSPCTLVIWGRKRHGKLETHVHAHSSDAYKKLLMNLQEFIAVHLHLASRLNLGVGNYYHIIDSCHIHREDEQASKQLAERLLANTRL